MLICTRISIAYCELKMRLAATFVFYLVFVFVCSSLSDISATLRDVNFNILGFRKQSSAVESVSLKRYLREVLENFSVSSGDWIVRRAMLEAGKRNVTTVNPSERQVPDIPPAPAVPTSPPTQPVQTPPAAQPTPVTPPCFACILVPLVAVAVAVGVSVPLSNIPDVPNFDPSSVAVNTRPQRIPTNFRTNSIRNIIDDDGCGKISVLFDDGNCYPLLRPCKNPLFWSTVDPITRKGRCSPRLCGRERVFVGRDQLCHDIEDPNECSGGRRLYYTAYGDPICDCPIGQFPFPTEPDNCVPLFTQGPCPAGQVFGVLENGFGCTPAECQAPPPTNFLQQLIPGEDGFCYPLGSQGPCAGASELLGYDIIEKKSQCVDVDNPISPHFESNQLSQLIDKTYNQRSAEFGDFEITLIAQNLLQPNDSTTRRQDLNTRGIFRIPTKSPTTLLIPCRPGPNSGNNYKCSNPLVPRLRRRELLQAVRSAFTCLGNAVLQAKGTCGGDLDSANCGPTYQFNSTSEKCQKFT